MKYLSKILLLSTLLIMFLCSTAQEETRKSEKQQRKEEKKQKKIEKKQKEAAEWLVYQKYAQDREFVVQFDKIGNTLVSKRLNFIYIDGEDVLLQFETNAFFSENGLGGRTINGIVSNYKYEPPKNDNKPIFINFDITSKFNQQNYNISINVYSGGVALISFGGGISSVNGFFVSIENADINTGADMRK